MPRSVLIVDDLKVNRMLLQMQCQRLGVEFVTEVADAEEALDLLREAPFDCVLTDLKMPGMDGVDFIRAVRNEAGLIQPKIILVTAEAEACQTYRRMGADGILIKPVSIADLSRAFSVTCPSNG